MRELTLLKLPAHQTLLLCALGILLPGSRIVCGDEISFNRQIRPILADICFNCHGPDTVQNEGGVRLDVRESAVGEGDSGEPIIVPGKAANSELVRRLLDTDEPMPPADFEKQLTPQQIETISQWIDEGAKYEGHWAFAAPVRPDVPKTKDSTWTRTPVDHFVLARLEQNSMQPSAQASKSTLIRRLALDLTGLPPTTQEVAEFLADESPDAYERLVDRLLMSPHYGERMAIPWLDYARYADSNGFQSDGSRDIWAWRDWVINAYNRNLTFDKFTVQQLAGDMLPNPSRAQIVATGFNRNHRLNGEGGRIVDEWFVETVIDRVETTGLTWLGLTFNCCRCHDHKYDPISQKEFYQMFAFFNSVDETGVLAPAGKNGENTPPLLSLTTPQTDAEVAKLEKRIAEAQAVVQEQAEQESELVAQWESKLDLQPATEPQPWKIATPSSVTAKGGVKFKKKPDGSYLASGKNPKKAIYTIELPLKGKQFTGLMIEAFPDPSLPNKFLGRNSNGNFVLTDLEMEIAGKSKQDTTTVKFERAEADFEQPNWTAASVLKSKDSAGDKQPNKGWATLGFKPENGSPNRIMFVTAEPVALPASASATIRLIQHSIHANHNIGRFRLQTTEDDPADVTLGSNSFPDAIRKILAIESGKRNKKQQTQLNAYFRANVSNPIPEAQAVVEKRRKELKEYQDSITTSMVMKEGKKRDAFMLERGEYDKPGDKVERGLPAFLPPMPEGQPMDRLGLANWIVDRSNPLTARVWVNRQWENLFGVGLVKTSENFGTQADFPSHPELLDWLAVEFMEAKNLPEVDGVAAQPWDMKAMIKLLVMSSTYRQSSHTNSHQLNQDPENRLLSRGPRFRLTGELIRDQALAVSGLLEKKIGGPSVRPYMPPGVWDETSKYGNLRNYKPDVGEGLYRRTMYTIWKRTAAPPSMLIFDAPSREVCTVKRSKTNTPLQALALLNEITYVEAAQQLAKRMIREGGKTPEEQIKFGFLAVMSRQPSAREFSVLVDGFESDLAKFQQDPSAAAAFLKSVNESGLRSVDAADIPMHAALALTANVLLNLDEFVTRE